MKAFINSKKDTEVNKTENFEISIGCNKKENLISVIKILFSENNKKPTTEEKSINFKFGDNSCLSSKNPIRKKRELNIKKM